MTVESSLAALSDVEASLLQAMNTLAPLTRKNPPLPAAKLRVLQSELRSENPSSYIRIGDDVLGGIFRHAIGSAKANVVMARRILTGPNASRHLNTVARLVDTAKHVVRQLEVSTNAVRTVQDWTGPISASSLTRLHGLGLAPPMWLAGLALVAGIVVLVVGVVVLVDTMQRAQNAEIALRVARETCDRAEASGAPCTPDDFQRAYEEAARAQAEISPPILGGGDDSVGARLGDLVFWGGLLAVTAGVGYVVWTTLPAAQSIRQRGSLIR